MLGGTEFAGSASIYIYMNNAICQLHITDSLKQCVWTIRNQLLMSSSQMPSENNYDAITPNSEMNGYNSNISFL